MTLYDALQTNMLIFIVAIPIIGAICVALTEQRQFSNTKPAAIWTSWFVFLLTIILCVFSDKDVNISLLNNAFSINGISLCFITITSFTIILTHLYISSGIDLLKNSYNANSDSHKEQLNKSKFYILTLLLEALCILLFSSTDILIFFFLLELIIVIIFLLCEIYANDTRDVLKFFIIASIGSLCVLFGIMYIVSISDATDLKTLITYPFTYHQKIVVFITFFIGLTVQYSFFPLQSLVMELYKQIPTSISIIFSGIFSLICSYGIFVILLPLTYDVLFNCRSFISGIVLLNMLHAILLTVKKQKSQSIIAGISILHTLLIIIGMTSCSLSGITGAFFYIIVNSVTLPSILITYDIIEYKVSLNSKNNANTSHTFRILIIFTLIFLFSTIFVPLFPYFFGAILIVFSYLYNTKIMMVVCLFAFFGIPYALKPLYLAFLTKIKNSFSVDKIYLIKHELIYLVPSVVFILFVGFSPNNIIRSISHSITSILPQYNGDKGML